MNRREFTALIAAGAIFPRELFGKEQDVAAEPSVEVPGLKPYPLYYMRGFGPYVGLEEIYQLWQPGIILGVRNSSVDTVFPPLTDCEGEVDLYNAIRYAQPHSLIVESGFGRPYEATSDDFYERGPQLEPTVLDIKQTKALAADGRLRKCNPFCTFDEWLDKWNFLVVG